MGLFNRKKKTQQPAAQRASSDVPPARQRTQATAADERPQPLTGPTLDPFLGDESLRAAQEALVNGSWTEAHELLEARDGCGRSMAALSEATVPLETYNAWVEDKPTATTKTVLGRAYTSHAWKVRGGGVGSTVSLSDSLSFLDLLQIAEEHLLEAAAMDITRADPWALLITTGMGLQHPQEEIEARFERAHARQPFYPRAVFGMLQAIAPKWGGTEERLLEFARWVTAGVDDDSPAITAILTAHYEIEMMRGYASKQTFSGLVAAMDKHSEEIEAVCERLVNALPDLGPAPIEHLHALNDLALWVQGTGEGRDRMKRVFHLIDNRPTEYPWRLMGGSKNPAETFQGVQQHRLTVDIEAMLARYAEPSKAAASG